MPYRYFWGYVVNRPRKGGSSGPPVPKTFYIRGIGDTYIGAVSPDLITRKVT